MSRARKLPAGVETIRRAGGRVVYRGRYRDQVTQERYSTVCYDEPTDAAAARVRGLRDLDDAYRRQGIEPVRRQQERRETPKTMAALGDAYLAQLQGAVATRRNYAQMIKGAVEFFGADRKVADVDRPFVREWVRSMIDADLAKGTRANRLSTLRSLFALAAEYGVISRNPCEGVEAGQGQRDGERRVGRYPTEQEIILSTYFLPDWLWPMVFVAADSGLRRSELAGLRWSSVDLENALIYVADVIDVDGSSRGHTKRRGGGGLDGQGQAWVPMSSRTVEALRALLDLRASLPSDRVFRRPRHDHVAPGTIYKQWRHAREQAMDPALGAVRVHDLRWHTATEAAGANIATHVIMAVMRHSSPRMTHRYIAKPDIGEVAAQYRRAFK